MRLVEESLRGNSNLKIHQNFKIPNTGQRKREIDILIEGRINGFSMRIAIECKNYSRPVPVKEIEAFNSKCARLPGISKKVFISASGYQADALLASKEFDIDMLTAAMVKAETVQGWIPLKQLKLLVHPEFENVHLSLDCDDALAEKYQAEYKGTAYLEKKHKTSIEEYLVKWRSQSTEMLWKLAIWKFMNAKGEAQFGPFELPFRIEPSVLFVGPYDSEFVKVKGISFAIKIQLNEVPANIVDARDVTYSSGASRAKTITVDYGGDLRSQLVLSDNQEPSFYLSNEKGAFRKLKTLLVYDPKTGNISKGDDD